MKTITLLPADTYTVVNKSLLNNDDRKNLIALYEPIIGPIAVALYLTLWNDLDKIELTSDDLNHHHLMTIMKIATKDKVNIIERNHASITTSFNASSLSFTSLRVMAIASTAYTIHKAIKNMFILLFSFHEINIFYCGL